MEDLKKFANWWSLLGVAGGSIAAVSITQHFTSGFWIGLGLLFFGAGEWNNHGEEGSRKVTIEGLSGFRTVPFFPRKSTILGLVLDAIGIASFAFGIFLVAFAP